MADERSTPSVNVAHMEGNEVSEINHVNFLLISHLEKYLPFSDACPNGWVQKFSSHQ